MNDSLRLTYVGHVVAVAAVAAANVAVATVVAVGLWPSTSSSPSSIASLNGVQFDYSNMNYSSCSLNGQL